MLGKSTSGPWEWREEFEPVHMRTLSPGILVLDNDSGCGGPWGDEIDRANARLIAASPELLEALKWFVDQKDKFDQTSRNQADAYYHFIKQDAAWDRARAIIAKATGKE